MNITSKMSWKQKAWIARSEYVRRKEDGICFTCGQRYWNEELGENDWKRMEAGHYIHNKLDFDDVNIHCQCTKCNRFLHGNLGIYAERLIFRYGVVELHSLRIRASQEKPHKADFYKEMFIKYGNLLDSLV